MSKIENIVTEEELSIIENEKVSETIEKEIKEKSERFIYRELFATALENVKSELPDGEVIDEYIIGRDYKTDTTRIVVAGSASYLGPVGGFAAHPMNDWSAKAVLIKTNRRLLIMETGQHFEYLRHYEVGNSVKVFTEKTEIYLEVFDINGQQKLVELRKENKEEVLAKLFSNGIDVTESKEALNCTERKVYNKELIITWIIAIIIIGIFLFNFFTKGIEMFQ